MAEENKIIIKVNTDEQSLNKSINDVEKAINDVNKSDDATIRIKTALDNLSNAKSLQDYKKSLRELKGLALEVGDTNITQYKQITQAIGETNDKIGDMNSVIKSTSGEPIENLGNSFKGVRDNLRVLDFKTAKAQFDILTNSAKKLTSELFGGFNVLKTYRTAMAEGKTATEGMTIATKSFGKALAATGIGLIVIAVAALIANFDKLKESGGVLGSMFTAIGDTIDFVVQKLKDLGDWLGLTDFKSKEKAENTVKNAEKEQDAIAQRYDDEIRLAKAAGKDTANLEKEKTKAVISSIQTQIQALETLKKSTGTLSEDQTKQLEDYKKKIKTLQTDLAVIDAESQKKKDDDKKKADEKAEEDRKKELEKQKHHNQEVRKIEEKYLMTEREKIAAGYDDDLKKLNIKNEKEKKLYDDLLFAKAMALDKYDKNKATEERLANDKMFEEMVAEFEKEQKAKEDARQRDAQAVIDGKQIELDQLKEKEQNAKTGRIALLEEEGIKREELLTLQKEKQLSNTELTESERANIIKKYNADIQKNEVDTQKAILEERFKNQQQTLQLAADATNAIASLSDALFTIHRSNLEKGGEEEKKAAKQQFDVNKGLQLGVATIIGIQSVMAAYQNGMKNPIPLLGPATATIYAVTAGIAAAANLAKIAATKFDASSFSPSSVSAPSTPTPKIPTPTLTSPSAGSVSGLGKQELKTIDGQLKYQKVYVTETDIRDVTSKVNVIENRSRIK